ncbi:MAG: dTDP-4-dehydrorhamnose reductase [Methyloprofundus sp.]|nr:dTDP-4-dehydrorhamnose reductase [Methyloprofundus sp.]
MKILLLGKNGQLGWELQRSLAPLGEVIALQRTSQDYCGDLTNLQGLATTIQQIAPDIIVNAAAYTAVDKAESEAELAQLINADAPAILAQQAKLIGAWLIHYSTDYVFDGSGTTPWQESDTSSPLSVYGASKLAGEQAIQDSGCQHLIFRTSWVYATRGNNFAKTMLRLARERDNLSVINDQIGAPTGADLLADVTAHVIRTLQTAPELAGLYHLVASGETSWHGFSSFVIDYAQKQGDNLKTTVEAIAAVPTSAFPTTAKRPNNSRLNTDKLQTNFALTLPDWQSGVTRMLTEILEK